NSGKRLLTNAEWQAAALGTPDGPPCFVDKADDEGPAPTGTPGCTSDVGAYDMVGNVSEWVADWIDRKDANVCTTWPAEYGTDLASSASGPSSAVNALALDHRRLQRRRR